MLAVRDVYVSNIDCLYTDPNNCTFDVTVLWEEPEPLFRGGTPPSSYEIYTSTTGSEGPWALAGSSTTLSFVKQLAGEDAVRLLHAQAEANLWFRVRAVWANGEEEYSEPFSFEFPPTLHHTRSTADRLYRSEDQMRVEISKVWETVTQLNTDIYYANYGEYVVVLKRKWAGTLCTCYNPLTRRSEDPYHQDCWGTGITGGYEAYRLKGLFQYTYNVRIEYTQQGYEQTARTLNLILPPTPPLLSNDYVVRVSDGVLFRVGTVSRTKPGGIVVHQQAELYRADPSNPLRLFPYYSV